jgi:hypothetical protein
MSDDFFFIPGQRITVVDAESSEAGRKGVVADILPVPPGPQDRSYLVALDPDGENVVLPESSLRPDGPAPSSYPSDISLVLLTDLGSFSQIEECRRWVGELVGAALDTNLVRVNSEEAHHPHQPQTWDLYVHIWTSSEPRGDAVKLAERFNIPEPPDEEQFTLWERGDHGGPSLHEVRQLTLAYSVWPWRD